MLFRSIVDLLCCTKFIYLFFGPCHVTCGMLVPRPGLEPVSPALAGRFSTTAPPGKPRWSYFYSCIVRPTDQEMIFFEKIVCYSSQEKGACQARQGCIGKHWVGQEAERENVGKGLYCGFCRKVPARQGKWIYNWLV